MSGAAMRSTGQRGERKRVIEMCIDIRASALHECDAAIGHRPHAGSQRLHARYPARSRTPDRQTSRRGRGAASGTSRTAGSRCGSCGRHRRTFRRRWRRVTGSPATRYPAPGRSAVRQRAPPCRTARRTASGASALLSWTATYQGSPGVPMRFLPTIDDVPEGVQGSSPAVIRAGCANRFVPGGSPQSAALHHPLNWECNCSSAPLPLH